MFRTVVCSLFILLYTAAELDAQLRILTRPNLRIRNTTSMGLSFAQSSVSDWREGEKQNLEINASLNFARLETIGPLQLGITSKFNIGVQQQTTEDSEFIIPTDNEVFAEGVLQVPVKWKVDPYFSASVRTQITESFRISGSPLFGQTLLRTAKLWDPVTSQQGIGFTYYDRGSTGYFSTRIGVSLRQIRADVYTRLTDDFKTRDVVENYRADSGIEFVNDADIRIDSAITYKARLSLFGTFDDLEKWTVRWENEFRARVWRFIGVTLRINVYFDEQQSIDTQYRQSLTLGLLHSL